MGIRVVVARDTYSAPRPSDALDLNAWLAQLEPGVTARLRPGVYETDRTIVIPFQRHLAGQTTGQAQGTTIRQATGAAIQGAILTTQAWHESRSFSGNPVMIADLRIDGNRANCPGSDAAGITLLNYHSIVRHVSVVRAPGDGISLRDRGRDGVTVIQNSASENRIESCNVTDVGRHAYYAQCAITSTANQDGFLTNCTGSQTGGDLIRIDRAAGWLVRGNHGYTVGQHGLYLQRCWATRIAENYVEDFGRVNAAGGVYNGIAVFQLGGRASHVMSNSVSTSEPAGTAVFRGLFLVGQNGQAAALTCVGNELYGGGSTRGRGLVAQVEPNATLALNEGLNHVRNFTSVPTSFGVGVTLTGTVRTA